MQSFASRRPRVILAQLFEAMRAHVRPGVTTGELDRIADEFIRGYPGAKPGLEGIAVRLDAEPLAQ